jgi:hypothetical protein
MIVNPQFFNYRLIIGSLVVAIVVLGSYSFSSYSSLKDHQEFLEQESKLVQNELTEMISFYDEVNIENEAINMQLEKSKSKVETILEELRQLKTNVSLISKYKAQIWSLKLEKDNLFILVKTFEEENKSLKDSTVTFAKKLESQNTYVKSLEEKNTILSETLKKVETLSIVNINAVAIKTISSLSVVETDIANQADHFEVCFTLSKNDFTPKGKKNLYVQILDSNNNIVVNRGTVQFEENNLEYSGKTKVYYINENVDVCVKINVNTKLPLSEGTYFATVFHDDQQLGGTEIYLN